MAQSTGEAGRGGHAPLTAVRVAAAVEEAAERIRSRIVSTPCLWSAPLSERVGCPVWLKLENLQTTGSFKLRGALNKLLGESPQALGRGVVTASSGNHGLAVAYAARGLGCKATVFLAEDCAPTKRLALKSLGARLAVAGEDVVETEGAARRWAEQRGRIYVPPYNDSAVIAGQGTVGAEILAGTPEVASIYVAVGGGGLISGVAGYVRKNRPEARVVGCQPVNSDVMRRSLAAGEIVQWRSRPTLSDGTAGGIEANSITFEPCRDWVSEFITVTESQIARALSLIFGYHRMVVEGAAGVALAALLNDKAAGQRGPAVVVLCGANAGSEAIRSLLTAT